MRGQAAELPAQVDYTHRGAAKLPPSSCRYRSYRSDRSNLYNRHRYNHLRSQHNNSKRRRNSRNRSSNGSRMRILVAGVAPVIRSIAERVRQSCNRHKK